MARSGAPGLALSLLDEAQPDAQAQPEQWARWERARIKILAASERWRRGLERLERVPAGAPEAFARWARERRAVFHLELGQAEPAGRLLRSLLWDRGRNAAADEVEAWRRLVIRAHLTADRVDDAVVALRRFDQDYADDSVAWAALRTRVLLRAGRANEAADRVPAEPAGELAALATLARTRAGRLGYAEVYRRSAEAAAAEDTSAENAARWWFVGADAAARQDDLGRRALALERALAHAEALPAGDGLFALGGEALWQAWLAFGRRVGNDEQLLIGDDEAWFEAAEAGMPQAPVRARSLLAVIAQQGGGEARARAHGALLDHLEQHGPGLSVARRAYLHGERYPAVADVPEGVRYRLVDDALGRGDLALASRLLSGLTSAPPDVERFSWELTRARVLVRGDRPAEGAAAVAQIVAAWPGLEGNRLDRLLQVIFDLQGMGEHERALVLLERVMRPDLPVQRRRELLYWQAESYEGREQYRRAAAMYMRSALMKTDPDHVPGADPWGQTARYQAAGMLAQAGLAGDARRIYQDLLRTTDDADRRSTLRHRLRRLPPAGESSNDRSDTAPEEAR